jgi:chromosome segregation ATPase
LISSNILSETISSYKALEETRNCQQFLLNITQIQLELANSKLQLERTKTSLETSQQNEGNLKAQLQLCKANETALNLELVRIKTLLEVTQKRESQLSSQISAQETNDKQKCIENLNNITQSLKQLQESHVSFTF